MSIAQTEKRNYTLEEYLSFELNSDERHESVNGEIVPMTGGTPEHNEIASILNAILRISLKGKPDSIFVADRRLWIPDRNLYTDPDVMVVQRPIQLQTGRTDTIINPVTIAEVLSKLTKSYDSPAETLCERDEKFAAYRTIPTFQEYLLIDRYTPHVEQYSKTDSQKWSFSEYDGLESSQVLASIPVEISWVDLYEWIEF